MSPCTRSGLLAAALTATLAFAAPALAAPAGTAPLQTKGSTDLGAVSQTRTLTLVLTPSDAAGLKAYDASAHAALTPTQFLARFAPSAAAVSAVTQWAGASGLTVDSVAANRLVVQVSGTTAALGSALGVAFDRFRASNGSTYVSTVGTASLPSSVAGDVTSILGLSDLATAHTDIVPSTNTTIAYGSSFAPQDFWSIYNAPSSETGSGQTLASFAEGDISQVKKDLAQFESQFGLPTVTLDEIDVGAPTTDTSGDDEWDLDTQYATAFAPGVSQMDVYVAPSLSDADLTNDVNKWVSDDLTKQSSFSIGECELLADVGGFISGLDTVLQAADAQGQTMFASSGDTGSQCPAVVAENGIPAGIPGVNYPASSPYAIGTGGTSILATGPTTEIGWYAGGGGSSVFESTPSWQSSAGGSFLGVERGVPDVALDADPNSGYDVIVGGTEEAIGGTSAAAPSWQGIWARAQAAHSGGLGFAGPVIYNTEPASAFNDIEIGANGLYVDTPGWDYVTGRGTPNITAFVNGA